MILGCICQKVLKIYITLYISKLNFADNVHTCVFYNFSFYNLIPTFPDVVAGLCQPLLQQHDLFLQLLVHLCLRLVSCLPLIVCNSQHILLQ